MITEQKKIRINEVEYTLQNVSSKWYIEMVERCSDKDGKIISSKYMTELLTNVIVIPKLTIADFDGRLKVLKALVKECEKFINGDDVEVEDVDEKNDTDGMTE